MNRLFVAVALMAVSYFAWAEASASTSSLPQEAVVETNKIYVEPYLGYGWKHQNDGRNYVEAGPLLDLTYQLTQRLRGGVGFYFLVGERPSRGFDYGGGPFLSYDVEIGKVWFGLRGDVLAGAVQFTAFDQESETSDRMEDKYLSACATPFIGYNFVGGFWLWGAYRYLYNLELKHRDNALSSSLLSLMYAFD
jgi:opacity protein-like surface antigen